MTLAEAHSTLTLWNRGSLASATPCTAPSIQHTQAHSHIHNTAWYPCNQSHGQSLNTPSAKAHTTTITYWHTCMYAYHDSCAPPAGWSAPKSIPSSSSFSSSLSLPLLPISSAAPWPWSPAKSLCTPSPLPAAAGVVLLPGRHRGTVNKSWWLLK